MIRRRSRILKKLCNKYVKGLTFLNNWGINRVSNTKVKVVGIMDNKIMLITYPDSMGNNLKDLKRILNKYFSKAACISPSISMCMEELKNEYTQAKIMEDPRVYFSFGTDEVKGKNGIQWMLNNILYFNDRLIESNASSYINVVEKGQHNEASWQLENQIYLDYLWK